MYCVKHKMSVRRLSGRCMVRLDDMKNLSTRSIRVIK